MSHNNCSVNGFLWLDESFDSSVTRCKVGGNSGGFEFLSTPNQGVIKVIDAL